MLCKTPKQAEIEALKEIDVVLSEDVEDFLYKCRCLNIDLDLSELVNEGTMLNPHYEGYIYVLSHDKIVTSLYVYDEDHLL